MAEQLAERGPGGRGARGAARISAASVAACLDGLAEVVPSEDVRLSGTWSQKLQRRYTRPEQAGTGEGPFVDVVDWRWVGTLDCDSPLTGLVVLATGGAFFWAKAHPPASRPEVTFSASAWAPSERSVTVTGAFHGAHLPAVPVAIDDAPPASWILDESMVKVGRPHVVAEVGGVALVALVLPGSAVQVGRNRLWHLRASLAARLRPDLAQLLTTRRSGRVEARDAGGCHAPPSRDGP